MSKRLILISIMGIVLIGGAYWYTNMYKRSSHTPAPPPPRPVRQVARPRPPQPPTPAPQPQVQPQPVKPPVASTSPPGTPQKQAVAPPPKETVPSVTPPGSPKPVATQAPGSLKVEGPQVPSQVAKPAVTPRERLEAEAPRAHVEQPAPRQMARATEPTVKPEKLYSVQVASLVVEKNAISLKQRLEKLGYSPTIEKASASITRHRVYAGEFSDRDEAEQTARQLGVAGFPSNLIETGQRKFALEVGWSFHLNDALDLARNLQKNDYPSKIVSKASPTPVHVVRVGAYEDRADAVRASENLKTKGFAPLIVQN